MTTLIYVALALTGAYTVLNLGVWLQARKMQGKPAPANTGSGKQLYYFFSPGCDACKGITPIVNRLSEKYRNIHKIDVSLDLQQAAAFGIRATPTLILVDNGVIARVMLGGKTERELDALLAG